MSEQPLFGPEVSRLLGIDEARAMGSYVNDPDSHITEDDLRCDAERAFAPRRCKLPDLIIVNPSRALTLVGLKRFLYC